MVFGASDIFEPIFVAHMSKDADGSTFGAAVDASGAPQYWVYRPTSGIHVVARMVVYYQDAGAFDAAKYGNNITLTNGVQIQKVQGSGSGATVSTNFTDDPVITNSDWSGYCYDTDVKTWGVGDEVLVCRWSFWKTGRPGVRLDASKNQALRVVLNDDFTGLTQQRFVAWGYTTGDQT